MGEHGEIWAGAMPSRSLFKGQVVSMHTPGQLEKGPKDGRGEESGIITSTKCRQES